MPSTELHNCIHSQDSHQFRMNSSNMGNSKQNSEKMADIISTSFNDCSSKRKIRAKFRKRKKFEKKKKKQVLLQGQRNDSGNSITIITTLIIDYF